MSHFAQKVEKATIASPEKALSALRKGLAFVNAEKGWLAAFLAIAFVGAQFWATVTPAQADGWLWVNSAAPQFMDQQASHKPEFSRRFASGFGGGEKEPSAGAAESQNHAELSISRLFAIRRMAWGKTSSWILADRGEVIDQQGLMAVSRCLDSGACRAMPAFGLARAALWRVGFAPESVLTLPPSARSAWASVSWGNQFAWDFWGAGAVLAFVVVWPVSRKARRGALPGSAARMAQTIAGLETAARAGAMGLGACAVAAALAWVMMALGHAHEIERDLYYMPKTLAQVEDILKNEKTVNLSAVTWDVSVIQDMSVFSKDPRGLMVPCQREKVCGPEKGNLQFGERTPWIAAIEKARDDFGGAPLRAQDAKIMSGLMFAIALLFGVALFVVEPKESRVAEWRARLGGWAKAAPAKTGRATGQELGDH